MRAKGAFSDTRVDAKAGRQAGDAVAVAHPHRIALAGLPDAVEESAGLDDLDLGAAEFAGMAALDRAAELLGHGLLAVADAEHRHADSKIACGRARAAASGTEAGPPERITALGFSRWNASPRS